MGNYSMVIMYHCIFHLLFAQADSAAAAGRGALLPRRDSRQGAKDLRTGPGSRKGEKNVSRMLFDCLGRFF